MSDARNITVGCEGGKPIGWDACEFCGAESDSRCPFAIGLPKDATQEQAHEFVRLQPKLGPKP